MQQQQNAKPPSCLRYPLFMIGQDSRGNWVVQDRSGTRGGLFVDRAQALRFVRSENGNRPQGYVVVGGIFELDVNPGVEASHCQRAVIQAQHERRVA